MQFEQWIEPGARLAVRDGHGLQRMTTPRVWILAVGALVACGSTGGTAHDPVPYLDDASYRRSELVASLVNPNNGYSQLRLSHYATGAAGDWDLLPEWNPPVDVIGAQELDGPRGASPDLVSAAAAPLVVPAEVASEDDPALVRLGELAFKRYPVQLAPYLAVALGSRAAAAKYGLWVDELAGAGGLVRARMPDGTASLAVTCSTCHTSPGSAGALDPGRPNARLDIGAALLDAGSGPGDPSVEEAIAAWGPGRLDVTTSTGVEPVRIPDLRPVQWLTYLQQDATLAVRDRTTLAIRIETLIVTSYGEVQRPPRVIALALAAYISSLADSLPSATSAATLSPGGARTFATACAACHVAPALTGPPVPLGVIGTDPTFGLSPSRGTGAYRVPSLRGVGTRGPLLHDGSVPSLEAMFDPARTTAAFTGRLHGSGAVPGHPFGLDLTGADRAALLAYLHAL
jgi:mono/diheme cytochrome c family protein